MYQSSITKESGVVQDVKDSVKTGLSEGASGGQWEILRNLVTKFQDTSWMRGIINRVARSQAEQRLFGNQGTYNKVRMQGGILGDGTNLASDIAAWFSPDYKKHRKILGAIDTKGWGDNMEDAKTSFRQQWNAPNSKLQNTSYNYLKKNLFNTWDQPGVTST